MTMDSPVSSPTSEASRHGINLIACTLPLMAECNIRFNVPSGWGTVTGGHVGILSLFDNWVEFRPLHARLRHHSLIALEQMLSPDCKTLLTWKGLHNHIPSLSSAVPGWFIKIESVLGLEASAGHKHTITLPLAACPVVPNPFYTSLLPFLPVVAKLGVFVAVFPASFPEDGAYFVAQLIVWEEGSCAGTLGYHLQHWRAAEEYDDPGGVLAESGYFVQCHGDCEAP